MSKEIVKFTKSDIGRNLARTGGPVAVTCAIAFGLGAAGLGAVIPLFFILSIMYILVGPTTTSFKKAEASTHKMIHGTRDAAQEDTEPVEPKREFLSEYDCPNYDQITFELRMVEAGIMNITEVETCGNRDCKLCPHIERKARDEWERQTEEKRAVQEAEHKKQMQEARARRAQRATANDEKAFAEMSEADAKRVRDEYESTLNDPWEKQVHACNHGKKIVESWMPLCPPCALTAIKKRDENDRKAKIAATKARKAAERQEKERLFQERRRVNVNGVNVVRPLAVPEGAVPSLLHGREIDPLATHSYIVWKWTEDGENTKVYKQPISIMATEIHEAGSAVPVQTLYSAYDPKTGAYLGDYDTVAAKAETQRYIGWSEDIKASDDYQRLKAKFMSEKHNRPINQDYFYGWE